MSRPEGWSYERVGSGRYRRCREEVDLVVRSGDMAR
jgi:hypothetical protein